VSDDSNQLTIDAASKELSVEESSATIGSLIGSIGLPFAGNNGSTLNYFVGKTNGEQFPFYINAATGDVFVTGPVNATLRCRCSYKRFFFITDATPK
jgi:hypothetical protein